MELTDEPLPNIVVFELEIDVSEVGFDVRPLVIAGPPNIVADLGESVPNMPLLVVVVTILLLPNKFLEAVESPPKTEVEVVVVAGAPNIGVEDFSFNENIELDVDVTEVGLPKIPIDDFGVVCSSFLKSDVFSFDASFLLPSLS